MTAGRNLNCVALLVAVMMIAAAAPAAAATPSYSFAFEGAPEALQAEFNALSELKKGGVEYPTRAALRRAAKRDVDAFVKAMQSAGYYAAKASFRLERQTESDAPVVIFEFDPGALFVITNTEIIYEDEAEGLPENFEEADIEANMSAAGAALRDAQIAFRNYLWENGYPAAEIVARRASANFDTGTATAIFVFRSGPKAKFGDPKIEGLTKTHEHYLLKLTTWERGETYERSKIIAFRDRLAATGLFSTISVAPGTPAENGETPIIVTLEERKRRTIGAGVSYSTAEGPGGRIFFENRNMFRHGEKLRIELTGSKIEQAINFDFTRPFPTLPGEVFGNFEFRNETTDAFDARSVAVASGVAKKWLDDRLETRAAAAFETSKVKDSTSETRTYFFSTPLSATWNSEDDVLDPTRGVRASWVVTPYVGSDAFTQTELTARSRLVFGPDNRLTLAGRIGLGATFGSSLTALPRNKRLYAGGGGSVRGFGFQEAGPIDANDDPVGGRSLIEAAVEARAMVSQNIQIAGFVDTGSVSANALPDFDERFFVGVGGGVRYLTPIGPLRADVAFPLDKRDTDRSFQIFIAIGQPF